MHGFFYTNMLPGVASLWGFLSKFIAFVFGYLFRFSADECFTESDSGGCSDSCFDDLKGRQSSDDVDQGNREAENSSPVASSSKYEFLYRNGFSGFIEEPKAENFTVHELYMDSSDLANSNGKTPVSKDPAVPDIGKAEVETEDVNEEKITDPGESFTAAKDMENSLEVKEGPAEEKTIESFMPENVLEKEPEESALRFSFEWGFLKHIKPEHDAMKKDVEEIEKESVENFMVETFSEKPKHVKIVEKEDILEEKAVENYITEDGLEKHASDIQGNGDHIEERFDNFFESPVIDMYIGKWHQEKEEPKIDWEMLSPRNTADAESITYEISANRVDLRPQSHGQNVENMEHELHEFNASRDISDEAAPADISGPINDSDEEFIELEPVSERLCVMGGTQSREDLNVEDEGEEEEDWSDDDDDDDDELIQRLKMEMKMARTGGLATILEESSESPKMVEQLGPLKIDEKYDHKDHIAEIQKVYKSYRDKMRKLDILNSQTMHAISLLQLKDPVRVSTTFGKSSAPGIKSLLSHNVWLFKQRKPGADPAMKLIRDLHIDFETVYVGQVCLSWEILHWQYGKVKMLSESDRHSLGFHQYNQVAGEFQRFQVLVQRFLEDEPFQNRPRVENYTKNRRAVRHLLQVPVVKDDRLKNKLEDAVSDEMLTDIIEESMHVLWEFIRADKDDSSVVSKTPQQAQVAPHDPIDLELLMDVRADLQKKEKRFKEIQRSTNCIIKKLQRQQGGNLFDHALFIAQVELKLVSRVLNMLKISTDQLVWCHEKLQRINFRARKIEIEPSFTLFPC
ncbi:hypothetical protein V6N12_020513 [Hibiscus sabdariffa]|uniref:Ribosomal protein L34Ae n=1 Tax=Hibiscus sabdariffa TaxID=183260 RepID=A0ABR2CYD6_9ROSI